jgi:glucokinase
MIICKIMTNQLVNQYTIEMVNHGWFCNKDMSDCNLQFAHLNFLNLFMSMKKQCDNCSKNYQNLHSLIMSKKDLLYNTVMLYQTCFEEISSHRD